ncbi:MAG: response regulator, partial [Burkholderiaceae bacterium]
LIVDDNMDAAVMLAALLEIDGHECLTVHDGPSAIELAKSFKPDVAILDIGLPGMNGYEVARNMKKLPMLAQTMYVALTGYGQESDKRQAIESGFHHHLVKPINMAKLAELGLAHSSLGTH